MAWLSVLYFFFLGVFLVSFSFKRARAIYRFVKMVLKIPGPSWWELVTVHSKYLLGDDTITYICKLCDHYAYKPWGFFTTTLDYMLVLSDPDTVSEVFKNPNLCDKSSVLYGGLTDYLEKGSLTLNGDQWKWHRKTINPAFRKSNLDSRIDILNEGAENIVEIFRAKADGPSFDITDIIDVGTVDTSLRFITGNVRIVPSPRRFYEAVEGGMNLVQSKTLNPLYHWFLLRFDKATRELDRKARSVIAECGPIFKEAKVVAKNRISNRIDSQPVDVIECLSQITLEPGQEVDENELLDEALTMAVGGMETTRTAIKTVIMLLALHPDVQQRAYEEMQQIFGRDGRRPSPQDLQEMKYLDAVIKESLRLYPSIPLIGRKAKRTTCLNGTLIPRGACVLINIMSLHKNPNFHKDPFKFSPERFLTDGQEKQHPFSYLPFSFGPRTCVGYVQGIMTVKIVISAILRNFTIVPDERIRSMDDLKIKMSVSIAFREPLVKVMSRNKNTV